MTRSRTRQERLLGAKGHHAWLKYGERAGWLVSCSVEVPSVSLLGVEKVLAMLRINNPSSLGSGEPDSEAQNSEKIQQQNPHETRRMRRARARVQAKAKAKAQTEQIQIPDVIRAWEMTQFLDHVTDHIDVLSLDCFDTLLFRKKTRPTDVFYDLQHSEPFSKLGLTAHLRVRSEGIARSLVRVHGDRTEVKLRDIYRAAFPQLSSTEMDALAEAELQAEKKACFAFLPAVELLRRAQKQGLKTVIVSDTYLDEVQLRSLLKAKLPDDVYDCLDEVFCSSEYGRGKTGGLFPQVIEALSVEPSRIVHIGDNLHADYAAGRQEGVASVLFQQFDRGIEEVLRLSDGVGCLLDPEIRSSKGSPSVYHGYFSARQHPCHVEYQLGAVGIGPIFYAFAKFIEREISRLRDQGRKVKPVFLLRDAHLPQLVFQAISAENQGTAISVSRFASYAATFRTAKDVERYVAESAGSGRFEAMLTQLLLSEVDKIPLLEETLSADVPIAKFVELVTAPRVVDAIVEASKAYRLRLYRYLEKTVGLERGDTLLFVDLGYEGTAQRKLSPVLSEERGIEIRGCYLLAASVPGWKADRAGLMDPSHCDDRVIATIVQYIALIEDLCTANAPSVLDYQEDGSLVVAEHVISPVQLASIEPVQRACVDFAQKIEAHFQESGEEPNSDELRHGAMSALARLLFYPREIEVTFLEGFRLDLNMGTSDSFALFDRERGLENLRTHGLSYTENASSDLRTNYPIEMRWAGAELATTLLSQQRFGFQFHQSDLTQRHLAIDVLAMCGGEANQTKVQANATHDGFFSLLVSVAACNFEIGVLFGRAFDWVQLFRIELVETEKLYTRKEADHTCDVTSEAIFENVEEHGHGVLSFVGTEGFVFLSPKNHTKGTTKFVYRIVFRPIASKTPAG